MLEEIYALWQVEVKRYSKEKSQIISSIFTALLWLGIFGIGIGSMKFGKVSRDYEKFIFPGILGMTILSTSIRSGVSVLREREFGYLRAISASPASTAAIILGRVAGGATFASVQGYILLLLSFLLGIKLSITAFAFSLLIIVILSIGLVAAGMAIASFMKSFEGFNMVMSMLFLPMFFLSGALFPVSALPAWLQVIAHLNPLTYGVDALRELILEIPEISLKKDIPAIAIFSAAAIASSMLTFRRTEP
jgi:ABC-2 type transport system permease protein